MGPAMFTVYSTPPHHGFPLGIEGFVIWPQPAFSVLHFASLYASYTQPNDHIATWSYLHISLGADAFANTHSSPPLPSSSRWVLTLLYNLTCTLPFLMTSLSPWKSPILTWNSLPAMTFATAFGGCLWNDSDVLMSSFLMQLFSPGDTLIQLTEDTINLHFLQE